MKTHNIPPCYRKIKEICIMPPDLALLSILIGSNYPCLELIFMVPKVFEPLKFDCRLGSVLWQCADMRHSILRNTCYEGRQLLLLFNCFQGWFVTLCLFPRMAFASKMGSTFNLFKKNEFFHPYCLEETILHFRGVG